MSVAENIMSEEGLAPAVTERRAPPPSSYLPAKRFFDVLVAVPTLLVFALPMLAVAIAVKLTSKGPALYWSPRVGRHGEIFNMPKFRSMRVDTPTVASRHLNAEAYLTPLGGFLRKTSIDELPQLWSILVGKMSFVGPRAIIVQEADLLAARTAAGIDVLRPGLSGWAQVNGRDNLSIDEKVVLDAAYLQYCSLSFDLMIAMKTVKRVLSAVDVWH